MSLSLYVTNIVFFFQAEDGIRDRNVTGVQTCALPIYYRVCIQPGPVGLYGAPPGSSRPHGAGTLPDNRSEERRVGKECRSRCVPDNEKKKKKMIEVDSESI